MTQNETARLLQRALDQYESTRHSAGSRDAIERAGHDLANRIGEIIADIDADVARERNDETERESMTPVVANWPIYPKVDPIWVPVADSPRNSLDGE